MARTPPTTLSPSKLTSFTNCALNFRFVYVDGLPEAPTRAATRGTLVHLALERLLGRPSGERTAAAAAECLAEAVAEYSADDEWTGLGLTPDDEAALVDEARVFLDRYFRLEDPAGVDHVGLELELSATIGGITVRGIIDRLDTVDGSLVVTDYKTGRSPSDRNARARMFGVHVYSLLVERRFGRRPSRVQLLHLGEPEAVIAEPTAQSTRGVERKIAAVWDAIETACATDEFRANPGGHCDWCSFTAWCPVFGGDPDRAVVDVEIATRSAAGQDPLLVV